MVREPPYQLGNDEVHVWLARPDELNDPALLARYQALLSREERDRLARFRCERSQRLYLVAHALARCSMSRYAPRPPSDWAFVYNEYGRPEPTPGGLPLRFNLSHADGLAACAICLDRDIGVDVESGDRRVRFLAVAKRHFAPAERSHLDAAPPELQREHFFRLWTLKESYIKARGMGFSIPLHQVAFEIPDNGPIHATFDHRLADDPASWQFALFSPTPAHRMAVSVKCPASQALRISVETTTPLVR